MVVEIFLDVFVLARGRNHMVKGASTNISGDELV